MAAGNPLPNYYASTPLVAATLDGTRGLFHGADKAPSDKYLSRLAVTTNTASPIGPYKLLDYLLYYPFIDLDDTSGEQAMDNPVALPRYADGVGVMAMLVAVAPTVGGGSFVFNYVDHNGDAQVSPTITLSTTAANIASIVTSEPGVAAGGRLFLPLETGSLGVRSVTGLTVIGAGGGLAALVLVRPLADIATRELNAPVETEFFSTRTGPPKILDGAYLNMVHNCTSNPAGSLISGSLDFVWN